MLQLHHLRYDRLRGSQSSSLINDMILWKALVPKAMLKYSNKTCLVAGPFRNPNRNPWMPHLRLPCLVLAGIQQGPIPNYDLDEFMRTSFITNLPLS